VTGARAAEVSARPTKEDLADLADQPWRSQETVLEKRAQPKRGRGGKSGLGRRFNIIPLDYF